MHPLSLLHHIFFLAGNRVTQQSLVKKIKSKAWKLMIIIIIILLFALNIYYTNSLTDTCMYLCDRDKCLCCMHMPLAVLQYRLDCDGADCDGLDTGIWGCWKYTDLNTKEGEDLLTIPGAFRISQSGTPLHHLLWAWPVVVWKWGLQPMANCKFGEILSCIFS